MSNGLRGAREIGAAVAEQTALDDSNMETLQNMDAAISGIKDWNIKRQSEMIKLKQRLLASEENENPRGPLIVSPRQVSYEAPSTLFVTSGNQETNESTIGEEQYLRDIRDEDYDPVSDAMERKLRRQLEELQRNEESSCTLRKTMNLQKNDEDAFAKACIQRNMAKYGLSADQLNELTSNQSQSSQDLARVEESVRKLRMNMFASSIAEQCKSVINEDEFEKEAAKNGAEGCTKLLDGLDDYTRKLDETLFKLNALSEISDKDHKEVL